jgi:hypothetical protein
MSFEEREESLAAQAKQCVSPAACIVARIAARGETADNMKKARAQNA